MRKILFAATMLLTSMSFAQLQGVNDYLPAFQINQFLETKSQMRTTTCTADTVLYNTAKATASSGLSINNATSAYAISQYYDAPTTLTVEGAQFVGRKANTTAGITIDVTVALYTAGADSMPTGAPLATTMITIDTNFYGGNIAALTKTASFSSPVDVTAPYVIVVENNSATPITLYSSSYTAGDGDNEWLSSANLFGTWTRSYNVVVGGTAYNADMYFHPIVSYDIDNDFVVTPDCGTPGTVSFDVTNSPLLQNRMYSSAFYYAAETDQYNWEWGDASAIENIGDTDHNYAGAGPFNVTYTDSLFGWTTICTDATTKSTCSGSAAVIEAEVGLEVYPNPANGQVQVVALQPIELIQLFDISGKLIYTEQVQGQTQSILDLGKIAIGSYVLHVALTDGTTQEERLEVVR